MDATVKRVMREMSEASDEDRIFFPQVVKALAEAGVERYHADLIAGAKTYYLPNGEFETTPSLSAKAPAQQFSAQGVERAVRAIQGEKIQYREFCRLIAEAGCVGYFVSILGRRAVYYGRGIDIYVEPFPDAGR